MSTKKILGYGEYELDPVTILTRELPPFLEMIQAVVLTEDSVESLVPSGKDGIYLLSEKTKVRYIGKTDSKGGFRDRLLRHWYHIRDRKNLDPASIFFKAVAIAVFKNADVEAPLIEYYQASWNKSGFGNNDPGRNRDDQAAAKFDLDYPIDANRPIPDIDKSRIICRTLLDKLAIHVPYTFRYEKDNPDLLNTTIDIQQDGMIMCDVLQCVVNTLPTEWQATILPGRVILYPENRNYRYAQKIIRKLKQLMEGEPIAIH